MRIASCRFARRILEEAARGLFHVSPRCEPASHGLRLLLRCGFCNSCEDGTPPSGDHVPMNPYSNFIFNTPALYAWRTWELSKIAIPDVYSFFMSLSGP
jgi:hypothetical protein